MKAALHRILRQEKWTSIDVYSDNLARALRAGLPVELECIENQPPDLRLPGPAQLSLYINRIVLCPLRARRIKADVHHVLDNSYGHLVHSLNAKRTVVTSHGGTPRTWREWNREGPAMRFFDWAFAGMLKASRILIVSEYSKRELVDNYAFDPDRIHVVYHGVDEQFRQISADHREEVRKKYLLPSEEHLLLHVGHCAERKNVDRLLLAFGNLAKQLDRKVRLLQIGGEFTSSQKRIIEDNSLEENVTQIGQFPNQRLVELYNAADVFVFPSLYEGFGLPLIEAMASGCPVACSEYELFHEVCADGALFFDPNDEASIAETTARLISNTELRKRVQNAGFERSRLFRWEETARRTRAVYSLVAEEAGPVH